MPDLAPAFVGASPATPSRAPLSAPKETLAGLLEADPKTGGFDPSGAIPAVRLTEVVCQAAASRIVTGAHRINKGQMPELAAVLTGRGGADLVAG